MSAPVTRNKGLDDMLFDLKRAAEEHLKDPEAAAYFVVVVRRYAPDDEPPESARTLIGSAAAYGDTNFSRLLGEIHIELHGMMQKATTFQGASPMELDADEGDGED